VLLPPIPESLWEVPKRSSTWVLPDSADHPAYSLLLDEIESLPIEDGAQLFRGACVNDFYFFVRHCLSLGMLRCNDPCLEKWYGRSWFDHPWLFGRCRELQMEPDGKLDLWPRFHFKTSLITQALTLWDFLLNPDLKVGIGTYKIDTTGEAMVQQLRTECERNEKMKWHFPYVFWADPERESPEWMKDSFRFRQTGNSREPSVMIFSVIGALPTSFHFDTIVLDDMVTERSIDSADAIERTTEGWRRTAGIGGDSTRRRMVGTHWAHNDTYRYVLDQGAADLRYHDVFLDDGKTPVLRSYEWVHGDGTPQNLGQRLIMGPRNFAAQIRNKPSLGTVHSFEPAWLRYYERRPDELMSKMRRYLLIDTSASRSGDSDFNVLMVMGVMRGIPHPTFYLLDMAQDRMNLATMTDEIFRLAEKWKPSWSIIEQMGAARDIDHLRLAMPDRGFSFRLMAYDSKIPKENRIERLQLYFEQGRIYLPRNLFGLRDGRKTDLVYAFVHEQYSVWTPSGGSDYDDVLDTLAMIAAPELSRYIRPPDSAHAAELDRWAKPEGNEFINSPASREGLGQRAWAY